MTEKCQLHRLQWCKCIDFPSPCILREKRLSFDCRNETHTYLHEKLLHHSLNHSTKCRVVQQSRWRGQPPDEEVLMLKRTGTKMHRRNPGEAHLNKVANKSCARIIQTLCSFRQFSMFPRKFQETAPSIFERNKKTMDFTNPESYTFLERNVK